MAKTKYKLIIQPPGKMRYPTIGDYYKIKDGWIIAAVDLKNPDYNFLTLIHELIELYLTQRRGIPEPAVKKFDEWVIKEKTAGRIKKTAASGRHPKAPYRREHIFAEKIEKMVAKELGVDRKKQEKAEDKAAEILRRRENK